MAVVELLVSSTFKKGGTAMSVLQAGLPVEPVTLKHIEIVRPSYKLLRRWVAPFAAFSCAKAFGCLRVSRQHRKRKPYATEAHCRNLIELMVLWSPVD